ncbi:acyl transferase 4-like [Cynara cardunculus var. scolymus]|uniref:acyl transferase 4-like n=1 Tax=Cynara cardunculus var. scolymus TaxID=59895 RepID=UPI000D6302BF|nr:acyl transferase 4-like [Cynara cardunculus var. scolymus]
MPDEDEDEDDQQIISNDAFNNAQVGEGVWFVEASANCTLKSAAYFEDVTSIPFDKLLPHNPPQTQGIDPLVLMFVTEFEGDGFVMGLAFCHTICDGLGAAQFLSAFGEFARGAHQLTISRLWHFNCLPQPQTIINSTPPPRNFMRPSADYELEQDNIDIPLHHINQLKQHSTHYNKIRCWAFVAAASAAWKKKLNPSQHDSSFSGFASLIELFFFRISRCRLGVVVFGGLEEK